MTAHPFGGESRRVRIALKFGDFYGWTPLLFQQVNLHTIKQYTNLSSGGRINNTKNGGFANRKTHYALRSDSCLYNLKQVTKARVPPPLDK